MTRHCADHLVWYDYHPEGSRWILLDLTRPHPTARGGFVGLGEFLARPACVVEHQRICERVRLTDDPEDEPALPERIGRDGFEDHAMRAVCSNPRCVRNPSHVGPCRVPVKDRYL